MANRPAVLCKLKKGVILDAQQGFVDTFNWMVDFINNLKGEGEVDDGKSDLVVDRSVSDNPVIRGGSKDSGGGSGIKVIGTDATYADGVKELTIASGDDSYVVGSVTEDDDNPGKATLAIDVYYT